MAGPISILTIVGPTAAGKTAYAIARALELQGEIISVDSRQVYRGFVIGTAQPTTEEQDLVRHHLINCLDPAEKITAGRYVQMIHKALADIVARGKTPILCGGTGLYVRALRLGLAELGAADPDLRERIAERIAREGAGQVYAAFAEVDPDYAATFHPNNIQRLSRALEILEVTGQPPSRAQGWRKERGYNDTPTVNIAGVGAVTFNLVGLERPRDELYRRIDRRVMAMMEAGWLEEVEGLLVGGISPEAHPMQGVGYRELVQVAQGELTLEEAAPLIRQRTRNFARRQLTWFRKEPVAWVGAGEATSP